MRIGNARDRRTWSASGCPAWMPSWTATSSSARWPGTSSRWRRGPTAIGFCFSYAAEMTPDKDGKLLYFTKEIKARGVVGELIGANLRKRTGRGRGPAAAAHRPAQRHGGDTPCRAQRPAGKAVRRFHRHGLRHRRLNVAYVESNATSARSRVWTRRDRRSSTPSPAPLAGSPLGEDGRCVSTPPRLTRASTGTRR